MPSLLEYISSPHLVVLYAEPLLDPKFLTSLLGCILAQILFDLRRNLKVSHAPRWVPFHKHVGSRTFLSHVQYIITYHVLYNYIKIKML